MEKTSDFNALAENGAIPIILFDDSCQLCRSLAAFASGRAGGALGFAPWSSVAGILGQNEGNHLEFQPPKNIGLLLWNQDSAQSGAVVEGAAAWATLVERHPDLRSLNWLAVKLGLSSLTPTVLASGAKLLRKLCLRCPK